jgi:hypothetical protein
MMPFLCLGAFLGMRLPFYEKYNSTVILTLGVFVIAGLACGIAGCFRKGWRTALPILGVLMNTGWLIYECFIRAVS